jgi:putative transcriptional regulator
VSRCLLAIALAAPVPSQELAAGKLLVATEKSRDADFARSVIFLIQFDRQAALGVMVNRRSSVPVSEVFPDLKSAPGGSDPVYTGGPVTVGIRALLRSPSGDVSVISTRTSLAKLAASGKPSSVFRVYAGYTGWTAAQLQDELARGLWRILPGDANAVFDAHPETLWRRLMDH